MSFPPKKSSGLDILNQAADVVQKKHAAPKKKKMPPEGSPAEEASESPAEADDEGDMPAGNAKRKAQIAKVLKAKGI